MLPFESTARKISPRKIQAQPMLHSIASPNRLIKPE